MNEKAILVVRTDKKEKLLNALADIARYGRLNFADKPHRLSSKVADSIAASVMDSEVKKCKAAAVVLVSSEPAVAIGRIRGIHPPAHIIVLSARYASYELIRKMLPELPILEGYTPGK